MMDDDKAWFGPKRYGYGASPRNWQGLVATLAFIAIEIGITRLLAPRVGPVITIIAALLALVAFLALIAATSSRETWKWRWGGR